MSANETRVQFDPAAIDRAMRDYFARNLDPSFIYSEPVMHARISALKRHMAAVAEEQKDRATLQRVVDRQSRTLECLSNRIQNLEAEIASFDDDNDKLGIWNAELRAENERIKKELEELRGVKDVVDRHLPLIEENRKEREAQAETIGQLKLEIEGLREFIGGQRRAIDRRDERISLLESEITRINTEHAGHIAKKVADYADLRNVNENLRVRISRLEESARLRTADHVSAIAMKDEAIKELTEIKQALQDANRKLSIDVAALTVQRDKAICDLVVKCLIALRISDAIQQVADSLGLTYADVCKIWQSAAMCKGA